MTLSLFITLIGSSFLGSNVCMFASLVIPDEKSVTLIITALTFAILYALYYIYSNIGISISVSIFILIMLGVFITCLNCYLFNNRSDIITKI